MLPDVRVSELVLLVEDGLKAAVTPEGRPETANATALAKPLDPLTVMVLLAEELGLSERLADDVDSVKPSVETFNVMLAVPERLPEVPRTVTG
ncbi:MAG TPA: hypothetical protein VMV57_14710 [Terracidiphilus sp.]|nr:hypothetical protein [Terracidiphilus sp.]